MEDTWRVVSILSKPSSIGSQTSVISVESTLVTWCKPTILLFKISAIVTVLLIALPIAFKTTSLFFFSSFWNKLLAYEM